MKGVRMKTSELLKLLKSYGIVFVKHGRNHDIYYSPITGRQFPLPRHKGEMKQGTCDAIFKQAGIK